MSLGPGNLITSQRTIPVPPPGPPFTLNSADNGLSVDPVTRRIVLGNDFLGTAAQLLNNRFIPTGAFGIELINNTTFDFIQLAPSNSSMITLNKPATASNSQIGADSAEWDGGNVSASIGLNAGVANPKVQINSGVNANQRILEFSNGINSPIFQIR